MGQAEVAVESTRAMAFRTAVWLGIFAALFWLNLTSHQATEGGGGLSS
jgi:hypothetical protein